MPQKTDIFDRIFHCKVFRPFEALFQKHKEIFLYVFFGGLTTAVSLITFFIADSLLQIPVLTANAISWIFAVAFAYLTNRIWVFHSEAKGKALLKEGLLFYAGRLFSLGLEELILLVFVSLLSFDSMTVKFIAQFVVLLTNYLISKFLIFSGKSGTASGRESPKAD